MQHRTLGKTGWQVSEIGLGCWQFGGDFGPVAEETAHAILREARAQGVNFWDTADVYGAGESERRIGRFADKAGVRVVTKLGRGPEFEGMTAYTKARVKDSLTGSAKRLGVETLDLAQLHCIPIDVLRDGAIFTWLEELQAEGLIRHWGASIETIEQALLVLRADSCASLQTIFNLFRQDAVEQLFPQAQAKNVGIIVRLPLASGLLSGKMSRQTAFAPQDHRLYNRDGQAFFVGETFSGLPFEKGVDLADRVKALVPDGWTLADLALRWILDHPAVSTVIAGVTRPDQLVANCRAATLPPLFADLHAQLKDIYLSDVRPHVRGGI
jgi:aryl-alcohol dehydrogenase-like predicted oxidoreductase